MLQRLAAIQRVGAARALCSTLLRLLALCTRVRRGVRVLTRADTRALPVLLHALHLAAQEERDMPRAELVYQLLEVCLIEPGFARVHARRVATSNLTLSHSESDEPFLY